MALVFENCRMYCYYYPFDLIQTFFLFLCSSVLVVTNELEMYCKRLSDFSYLCISPQIFQTIKITLVFKENMSYNANIIN